MLQVFRSILSGTKPQATTPRCALWTYPCRDQPRFVRNVPVNEWWLKNHFYILLVNIWDVVLSGYVFDSLDQKIINRSKTYYFMCIYIYMTGIYPNLMKSGCGIHRQQRWGIQSPIGQRKRPSSSMKPMICLRFLWNQRIFPARNLLPFLGEIYHEV